MRIAICDDDPVTLKIMLEYIEKWSSEKAIHDIYFQTYSSAESLLYSIEEQNQFDLFFLDLFLPNMNGYELARILRQEKSNAIIVFTTATDSFMEVGYEVEIYRYIRKPLSYQKICVCLDHAYDHTRHLGKSITVKMKGEYHRILQQDIVYISTNIHSITIHTLSGENYTFTYHNSFDSYYVELDNPVFLRCHRSYIINMMYVDYFTPNIISLYHEKEDIPIGRSYHNTVLNALRKFLNYKFD